jgi:hypothetical protein
MITFLERGSNAQGKKYPERYPYMLLLRSIQIFSTYVLENLYERAYHYSERKSVFQTMSSYFVLAVDGDIPLRPSLFRIQ